MTKIISEPFVPNYLPKNINESLSTGHFEDGDGEINTLLDQIYWMISDRMAHQSASLQQIEGLFGVEKGLDPDTGVILSVQIPPGLTLGTDVVENIRKHVQEIAMISARRAEVERKLKVRLADVQSFFRERFETYHEDEDFGFPWVEMITENGICIRLIYNNDEEKGFCIFEFRFPKSSSDEETRRQMKEMDAVEYTLHELELEIISHGFIDGHFVHAYNFSHMRDEEGENPSSYFRQVLEVIVNKIVISKGLVQKKMLSS